MGNDGRPSPSAWRCANSMNGVVHREAVGTPATSSLTESWIHHDVQDPQSPEAWITTRQAASSSSIASVIVSLDDI
jgi:hypothetical protein